MLRHHVGHGHHVGGVAHELGGGAVVGMVVVGPRREDEVGPELADDADHLPAHVQVGHELAVVVVEDQVVGADHGAGAAGLRRPPSGERPPAHRLVAGVAVRQRDETHDVAPLAVEGHRPPAVVGVVRMRADDEHPQRVGSGVRGPEHGGGQSTRDQRRSQHCRPRRQDPSSGHHGPPCVLAAGRGDAS